MNGAREECQSAEREADKETEKIKVRPRHRAPRAHLACAAGIRDANFWLVPERTCSGRRWMPAALHARGAQNLAKPVGKSRGAKNLGEEQKRLPRIRNFRDRKQRFAQLGIG